MERWFGPGEMARRLGVTPKALRVYERHGLVTPVRDAAGWRAYGPEQAARLHQVLVLRLFGLPLKRIGELLAGRFASLDAVLAMQAELLEARRREADHALTLIAAARAKLTRGDALSLDDLAQLTRETTMTDKMSDTEMAEVMGPLAEKLFAPDEQAAMRARKQALDTGDMARTWDALFAEAQALKAKGDPGSPQALDLARRWMAQVNSVTGGDPELNRKSAAMWQEANKDPDFARRGPFKPDLMAFVGEAWRRAQAG
ncbi:MAG TPA: MerR family transcriptional regulator [Phenylobacterium sp.]|jgi:DNA-binding transcriptional MerR regulator|uniref:MerR family transcriptional regulator n=1 Tax=Phenylobacterium sp. TaxID=1871053 RepID=UPI002D4167D3|nr:MerR family transcriptional regulator [Phenylobacterium sp.]HZZ67175.1 MerR family transcriptional regulator [Phenylobacterium sp.]